MVKYTKINTGTKKYKETQRRKIHLKETSNIIHDAFINNSQRSLYRKSKQGNKGAETMTHQHRDN